MIFCIETIEGDVFEVTDLFDQHGAKTLNVSDAKVCVIKFADDEWASAEIDARTIHRVH